MRRLLEACVAFAAMNLMFGAYYVLAADADKIATDFGGMATLIVALSTMIGTLITSTGALVLSFRASNRVAQVAEAVAPLAVKVEEVHANVALIEKNTNSIKDALVESTRLKSLAEGVKQGRAEVHSEQGLIDRGKLEAMSAAQPPTLTDKQI